MRPILLLVSLVFMLEQVAHGLNSKQEHHGSTLQLQVFHTIKPKLSWQQTVLNQQANDGARAEYLSSLVAGRSIVPIASGRQITQNPTYIVRANIGTPPQTLLLAVDTSNDAAWLPCSACLGCSSSTLFTPSSSSSFKNLSCADPLCKQVPNPSCDGSACSFNLTYGGSSISCSLVQDTLTLATDPIPGYTLGCIQKATGSSLPSQGLLGLGRGPLSLLSQTQSLYQSTFSYCLPSFKSVNFSGSLRLGPVSQPVRIKFTPLLKNPRRPSLYYVNLVAIKVGRRVLNIPPEALAFNTTTGAGTIFDSGTVFTRLVEPAYIALRDEFRKRVGQNLTVTSLGGFDTCYNVPIVAPPITFMFSGMNVTLPQDNYLIHSTAGTTTCLAMAAAPNNVNSVLNVIANLQQQNHRILYDVPNSRLGVARERCT